MDLKLLSELVTKHGALVVVSLCLAAACVWLTRALLKSWADRLSDAKENSTAVVTALHDARDAMTLQARLLESLTAEVRSWRK